MCEYQFTSWEYLSGEFWFVDRYEVRCNSYWEVVLSEKWLHQVLKIKSDGLLPNQIKQNLYTYSKRWTLSTYEWADEKSNLPTTHTLGLKSSQKMSILFYCGRQFIPPAVWLGFHEKDLKSLKKRWPLSTEHNVIIFFKVTHGRLENQLVYNQSKTLSLWVIIFFVKKRASTMSSPRI